MEVECIGNTQIIHMEETGMTQRTIGLVCTVVKSKVNISQNFVAFSEYMNFRIWLSESCKIYLQHRDPLKPTKKNKQTKHYEPPAYIL